MIKHQQGKVLPRSFEGDKSTWAILKGEEEAKKLINILEMKFK